MSSNFTAGAKCARHIKHPCRRDPTVTSDEAGHALLLRTIRAGRDRAHRGASGRCTGTGGVGARGVPVAVSFPSCLPRHGRRDAARTDAEAAIGACGVEAERQGARGHGDCLRCGLRDARGVHARVSLQLQHVAVRLQVAEVPAHRDRRSVWRSLQRRRCGTAIHRSRLRRTHHGSRYQGHAQASCRDREARRPVQPDSESVRAPGRRGRPRGTGAEGRAR